MSDDRKRFPHITAAVLFLGACAVLFCLGRHL